MKKSKILTISTLLLVLLMIACAVSAASNHIAVNNTANGNTTLKVSDDINTNVHNLDAKNKTVKDNLGNNIQDNNSNSFTHEKRSLKKVTVSVDKKLVYGKTTKVTVHVNPQVSGNVTLYIDGKAYNTTKLKKHYSYYEATFYLSGLKAGTHTIYAVYNGNKWYNNKSSDNITININKASIRHVSVDVANSTIYGNSTKVTVDVRPNKVSGNVTLYVDGKAYNTTPLEMHVIGGFDSYFYQGYFNLTGLSAGNHTIFAVYNGNENYTNKISDNVEISVNKQSTILNASDMAITAYTSKNLTATLKDANGNILANKNVTFTFNGKTYTRTTNANGESNFTITSDYVGSYPVTIKFAGDENYTSSNAAVTVKVNAAYVTISQIMSSAVNFNNYIVKYGKVPSTVTVNGVKYTTAQFTYLLSAALKNINAKKAVSTKINVINVNASNVNYKVKVNVNKNQYLSVVNTVYSKGNSGTLPAYVSVGGKKAGFNTYAYALSRALAFYKNNNRFPNSLLFTSYF